VSDAPPIVWSIAGTDSGGGAGLAADLRAAFAFGAHLCPVVAAVTAQNSRAVLQVAPLAPALIEAQLSALAEDLPPAAIKTGLLGGAAQIEAVCRGVDALRARGHNAPLVVDPVLAASSGAEFADSATLTAYRALIERATVVTPNRREAARLLGLPALAREEVPQAAARLCEWGAQSVAVTGGDDEATLAADWIDTPQARGWLALPRIETRHTHGTGCTFATSAAAALAFGYCEADALVLAKIATAAAVRAGYSAGSGAGPVAAQPDFARARGGLPTLDPRQPVWQPTPFAALVSPQLGLYAIVDSAESVARVLAAGCRSVQLRIKSAPPEQLRAEIARAVAAARAADAQLFINDHWRLALECGAYGVHLGQQDLAALAPADLERLRAAGLRLGISTHSYWEVCRARAAAPSYIACGPIHATPTKDMPWTPQGDGNLAYWCAVLEEPVVAIGGIDIARAAAAASCGAAGVAVLRAVAHADALAATVRTFAEAIAFGRTRARTAPARAQPTLPRGAAVA
jgi:hydroxymethylpyrimidine kinase/phosphomethylpyrimidine kinase/thiamine-phosphate diphosphorylase